MKNYWLYDKGGVTVSLNFGSWLVGFEASEDDLLVCLGPLSLMWSW